MNDATAVEVQTRCDECGESVVGKKSYKVMRGKRDTGLRMCAKCLNGWIREQRSYRYE